MNRVAERLARLVLRRPLWTLGAALAVGCAAAATAATLRFDTSFAALLPEDAAELHEVRELERKAGGTVELVIAVAGGDEARRLGFGRRLVEALRPQPWIQRADVEFPVAFFEKRRLLLLSADVLGDLKRSIEDEVELARARANPFYVDLEGDDEAAARESPWAQVDRTEAADERRVLPKRVFTSPDGRYLFVRVRPEGGSSNMAEGKVTLERIQRVVASLQPEREGLQVRYAGGLVVNQEQHRQMTQDLRRASVIALGAILLLVSLHVRRLGAPLVLALPLLVGVSTVMALTALTIGQLNLVSGFLVSVLLGLGIDFEIHLYLRYLEELTRGGDRRAAMVRAMCRTLPPCATAAATTAVAFFAMTISDFRGFREYGLIAGAGVLVTLLVTFVTLPPLALLLARRGKAPSAGLAGARFHRGLAWAMVIVGGVMLVLSVHYGREVRWHNDFRKLRGVSETVDFSEYVAELLGGSLSPAAILVKDLEQARQVERYLEPLTSDPSSGVRSYLSLASLVPAEIERKRPILREIGKTLEEVRAEKLDPADHERVEEALRLTRAEPWTVPEIPAVFRRQFQTVDGREQFVVVWPRSKLFEDREIVAWGRELNRIQADLHAMGLPVKIMDENRLAARVLSKMRADAPWVVLAGGLAVLLILFIDLRRPRYVLLVGGALAMGVTWMIGAMYQGGIDLNVFNLAVIPTIIGLGIDNAVHLHHRYRQEGPGSLPRVIATTGAASFLATATTAIGFGAAVTAQHLGIRSLGWLTLLGLTCTFVATTVFLPSLLRLLERSPARAPAAVRAASAEVPSAPGPPGAERKAS